MLCRGDMAFTGTPRVERETQAPHLLPVHVRGLLPATSPLNQRSPSSRASSLLQNAIVSSREQTPRVLSVSLAMPTLAIIVRDRIHQGNHLPGQHLFRFRTLSSPFFTLTVRKVELLNLRSASHQFAYLFQRACAVGGSRAANSYRSRLASARCYQATQLIACQRLHDRQSLLLQKYLHLISVQQCHINATRVMRRSVRNKASNGKSSYSGLEQRVFATPSRHII